MAVIPKPNYSTVSLIDKNHEENQGLPRPHMGVSGLGGEDERGLWLGFRWVFQQQFSGRLLRLFRRGHLEESQVVSDLQAVGCELSYVLNDQLRIDFSKHVSGSCDGIIMRGLPEAPSTPHLLEIKTISAKRFEQLQKEGVEKTNPAYWVQVHCYMYGITDQNLVGIPVDRCFFIAVCKDDDRIYTERIRLDRATASKFIERGQRIAMSDRMPEPTFIDPSHWLAKWSPYYAAYFPKSATQAHLDKLKTANEGAGIESKVGVNCRTCAHSTPTPDSAWRCELFQADNIPLDYQRTGCRSHAMHPDIMDLIGWRFLGGDGANANYQTPSGREIKNGRDGVDSKSMLENGGKKC